MGDAHRWLGAQHQVPDSKLGRPLQAMPKQCPADAHALDLRPDRQRTDLRLIGTRDDLASMRPRLQHDGADDLVSSSGSGASVIAARGHHGHEDMTVAVGTEPAQRRRVDRVSRYESACLVGGDPDLADHGHLAGRSVPNLHEIMLTGLRRHQPGPRPPPLRA